MRASILLPLFGAACALWGAEFWDTKPFTEWTWKEANKVLVSSPWSRSVQAVPDLNRMKDTVPPNMELAGGEAAYPRTQDGRRADGPTLLPTIELLVRWHSALTVRQAMARGQFGDRVGTSAEVAEFLARPQKSYVITVSRVPTRFFDKSDPKQLQEAFAESATLRVKGLKDMKPGDIQVETNERALTVFFAFPRDQAILLEHKEAEFEAHVGPLKMKSKFKLSEMVRGGKLDL